MKKLVNTLIIGTIVSLFSISAYAVNVPNTFSAGTPAVAAEVNANFTALENGINGIIQSLESTTFIYTTRSILDPSGVGVASCAAGEIVVSANCSCTGAPSAGTNYGQLFGCDIAGNGAIGGCYPTTLFDALLPVSPVGVTAVCSDIDVASPLPLSVVQQQAEPSPNQEAIDATNILRDKLLEMYGTLLSK